MKDLIKALFHAGLRLIPLPLYRRLIQRDQIGLFYHAVSERPLPHVRHLYPPLSPGRFERTLLHLKESFHPVSYAELRAHVLEGAVLPPNAVHLSFDDGYAECFGIVRPLLLKHQVPCTFFITTDFLDNQRMFYRNQVSLCIERALGWGEAQAVEELATVNAAFGLLLRDVGDFVEWAKSLRWADGDLVEALCEQVGVDVDGYLKEERPYLDREQLVQMAAEGFTIGAHSKSHPKLAEVGLDVMEKEIVGSCQAISELTGRSRVPFAFPNTASGIDRGALAEIYRRNPVIELMFDTKGIRSDLEFIVNRIWAEHPAYQRGGVVRDLRRLLAAAYREEAWEGLQRKRLAARPA